MCSLFLQKSYADAEEEEISGDVARQN